MTSRFGWSGRGFRGQKRTPLQLKYCLQPDECRIVIVNVNGEGEGRGPAKNRFDVLCGAAREYIRCGYRVVPIEEGQKSPSLKNWQELRITTHQVPGYFRRSGNIGLLLGKVSGHLVDVDLDCEEARGVADVMLPPTDTVTGRRSSPRSHRWYICEGATSRRFQDPISRASIIEIRSTGGQTLVGPSIHPSGEVYDYLIGRPSVVSAVQLLKCVEAVANHVIVERHGKWPRIIEHAPESRTFFAPTIDRGRLLKRASAYLGHIPAAISGQGGHGLTYTAATALVHGFGLTEQESMDLLKREYNPRCKPQWSEKELQHKIQDAMSKPHNKPFGWLL